ncbi:MAG: carboxymuconolactone decarboxylase family protein [Gemmatimonadales bacterium]
MADPRTADVVPADRAMLDYALTLTQAPHTVTAESVAALQGVGFDDRGIHDICAVTAYYAFVNRIADGLGVELEERFHA